MAQFSAPFPIRFSKKTEVRIGKASRKMGLSATDTIRLALDAGLPIIEALPRKIASATQERVASAKALAR